MIVFAQSNFLMPDVPDVPAIPRNSDEKNMEIRKDRALEDRIRPQVIDILSRGMGLPVECFRYDADEDYHHNTDIMIYTPTGLIRMAVRHRAAKYMERYKDEFCMRYRRCGTGVETEYEKARAGWGDYEFYGFLNEAKTAYQYWYIFDLSTWRKYMDKCETVMGKKSMDDSLERAAKQKADDMFIPFRRDGFGPGFVLVESDYWTGGLFRDQEINSGVPWDPFNGMISDAGAR